MPLGARRGDDSLPLSDEDQSLFDEIEEAARQYETYLEVAGVADFARALRAANETVPPDPALPLTLQIRTV
jgi:hypothetical protein